MKWSKSWTSKRESNILAIGTVNLAGLRSLQALYSQCIQSSRAAKRQRWWKLRRRWQDSKRLDGPAIVTASPESQRAPLIFSYSRRAILTDTCQWNVWEKISFWLVSCLCKKSSLAERLLVIWFEEWAKSGMKWSYPGCSRSSRTCKLVVIFL